MKPRKRSICVLDPATLHQDSLDFGICRSSNALCLHTGWLQHSTRCLFLKLAYKEMQVYKTIVRIVLCLCSWDRYSSWNILAKAAEQEGRHKGCASKRGEIWLVTKLGGHVDPWHPCWERQNDTGYSNLIDVYGNARKHFMSGIKWSIKVALAGHSFLWNHQKWTLSGPLSPFISINEIRCTFTSDLSVVQGWHSLCSYCTVTHSPSSDLLAMH